MPTRIRLLFLDGSFLVVSTTALRLLLPEKLLMPMPTASKLFFSIYH